MGRIRIAFLIISVVILSSTLSTIQALDFSQFYLPPCCYIPPQGEPYSGYASAIVSTKHEPVPAFREVLEETTNFSLSSNRTKAALPAESIRLYKLIVPIENEEETTTNTPFREDTTQLQPPSVTVENILFPDFENISEPIKSKRNSKSERILKNTASEHQKIILLDMEEPEDSYSEKKSLSELETKQIAGQSIYNESFPITTTISSLAEVKLLKPPSTNGKLTGDESEPLQEASSEMKTYSTSSVTRKMPAVWLQNLRRALYQSLTSEKTESSNQIGQADTKQRNSVSKQFWRTLRKAKLKYVDKLSQSSSELPEAIYLPSGQGPIVSGVVVNSPNGVELRLASELYSAPAEGGEAREECQCSLIHHGDIVMAYWTVSRIFNEHGNPALQYLVYPLPYTVPTPPELHSFPGNDGFRPSPIDPVANFKGVYQQTNNNGLAHQNNHISDFPNQQIPSPPYFHQLSNGHHRLEISPAPELHTTPIIPTGPNPNAFHSTHPQDLIKDYRGVLVENEHGYTPEFLNLYRTAILEHFRRKDAYHNKGIHYNDPEGSVGPTGVPLPHQVPTDLPHPHDPPVQENPIIGPTHLPPPPLTSLGPISTHNPHYPNSIQDILAPIHPPSGPSLPPLDADNFIYPHPADGPLSHNPPTGNYHPPRTHDKYPPKDRYPESYPKGTGKDKIRPHTPTKHPNNKDKYPYPPRYPVGEAEIAPYPFPPGKYPIAEGPGIEFRPQANIDGNGGEGSLPYKPPYTHPERPEPFQDRDRYDTNKIYDSDLVRPLTKGVGTAYRINDKLYYPDARPKPYVKYSTNKPQETKKLTQEINDGTYILNF